MEELDVEPTVEELNKVDDSLASGKTPGSDGIFPNRSNSARIPYCILFMKSFYSAGRKALCHRT